MNALFRLPESIAMKHSLKFATFGLAAAALAACVTPIEMPDAVLAYSPLTSCTPSVSLVAPVSLTPERPIGMYEQVRPVDANAPCTVDASGARHAYTVFALPMAGKAASVSAGSVREAKRLLAPRVFTLGADGAVIRSFDDGALAQRGSTVSVLFVPRADERYVVVGANPAAVGGKFSYVSVNPATAQPPAHITNVDVDAYRQGLASPYSYEGQAFARVYFADPGAPPAQ